MKKVADRDVTRSAGGAIVVRAHADDPVARAKGIRKRRARGDKMSDRQLLEAILDVLLALAEDRGIRL